MKDNDGFGANGGFMWVFALLILMFGMGNGMGWGGRGISRANRTLGRMCRKRLSDGTYHLICRRKAAGYRCIVRRSPPFYLL